MEQNGSVGIELPEIGRREFVERIRSCSPEPLDEGQLEKLFLHYSELRRWNRRVSLGGAASDDSIVERHYGESLAALAFLSVSPGELVDLGTGAGVPGFVLAVARPELQVTLVEARGRKWSFLKSGCRAASLSCNCLNARVGAAPAEGLPHQIDWVTSRAVSIEDMGLPVLLPRLAAGGSLLLWCGAADPDLPKVMEISRAIPIEGTSHRRILQIRRYEGGPASS